MHAGDSPSADPTASIRLSALLLYGGAGKRFGGEKAFARFQGERLIDRLLRVLDRVSDDVLISTNVPDLFRPFGRRIVADRMPGAGPLAGLQAALAAARHEVLAVVAGDMPFASAELLLRLAALARGLEGGSGYDAVVPLRTDLPGFPAYEPLHAVYHKRCLPAIEETLRAGKRRVVEFYPRVRVREVTAEEWSAMGADARVFANVNTPEDLARLEREGPAGG